MRKIILSAVVALSMLAVSCQKHTPEGTMMGQVEQSFTPASVQSSSLTKSEMHNMVCMAYYEKFGFHKTPCSTVNRQCAEIADSLFDLQSDPDSVAALITAEYQRLGLIDENGYFKPAGNEALLVSMEPNAELRQALLDIVNSTGHGPANVQWAKDRLAQVTSTDPGIQERAAGFIEIYEGSSELPYNEAYGGGWARADAAGWDYGNAFMYNAAVSGRQFWPWEWYEIPMAFAWNNSINNASCYEL